MELSGSFKCAKERNDLKKKFFFLFLRRRKEPVCVLRPPCDSGSCLLVSASIPAQLDLGGNTAWRREESKWVSWRPAGGNSVSGTGPAVTAANPAPALLTSSSSRWPQSPAAGRSEGQSGALLQLIDCESRMLNLLISRVVWARTVNYPAVWPPVAERCQENFALERGILYVILCCCLMGLFSYKPWAKYSCILRFWLDSGFAFWMILLTTSKLQSSGNEVRIWLDSSGNLMHTS